MSVTPRSLRVLAAVTPAIPIKTRNPGTSFKLDTRALC